MTPQKFGTFIVKWFEVHKRDFPWRVPEVQCDPYKVWISEVMLQQTQAGRVVEFFVKFMVRFPDVSSLSRASWEEVLECVRGLGYYRRFRNLIVAAQMVCGEFDGEFPRRYADLRRLPGVGEYTAGAILVFAIWAKTGTGTDTHACPLDTNVRQVLKKFFPGDLSDAELKKIAVEACPRGRAREFYQGMMDYAAAELRGKGKVQKREREQRSLVPRVRVAIGLVIRGKEVLIQTIPGKKYPYPPEVLRSPCYEFPGGKVEMRETERACLKRELMEELGIEAAVRPPFMRTEYSYGEKHFAFSWHRCSILLGEPSGKEGQEVRWVALKEIDQYTFPPADDEVVRALIG